MNQNPKRKHVQAEASEQEALFRWAEFQKCKYSELALLYHVPNGGSRNAVEAANLKRQGVKAGVPDVVLPIPRNGCGSLYIEMKANKNKPTDKQTEWIAALRNAGNRAEVCYSWEEAAKVIIDYLTEKEQKQ